MKPTPSSIKIQLRKDTPEGSGVEEASAGSSGNAATAVESASSAAEGSGSKSTVRRKERILNHPILVAGLYVVAIALLVWSLVFRLGEMASEVSVEARMLTKRPHPELTGRGLNPETVESLRTQVQDAQSYFLQGEAGVLGAVAEVERMAFNHGWRAEVSVKPALSEKVPLLPGQGFPLEVRLSEATPSAAGAESGYQRLVAFMAELRTLKKKIELQQIRVQARHEGVHTAELQFIAWATIQDEKTFPK